MPHSYDISRTVSPRLKVWPGDTPFSYQTELRVADGDPVNLTTITLSPHAGTHTDAPYHVLAAGAHPAGMSLDPFIGPARVVSVARRSGGILPADLGAVDLGGVQRVLLHTWYSDIEDDAWHPDFPYPTPTLIDWLADRGVILLGVDVPSVDGFHDDGSLAAHHRQFARGMVNLEMLRLQGVPDGVYELVALPLKLDAVCGSPVRAILRVV